MTMSSSDTPDPTVVLETIRTLLIPTPIISNFPTVLQLFAHLQLVSAQIASEAQRALEEQEILSQRLEEAGVPYEELIAHGSLGKGDGEMLERLSGDEESREDEMMDLSFNIRLTHIAMILSSAQGVPNERTKVLVDAYFPSLDAPGHNRSSAIDADTINLWTKACRKNRMCYVRAMTEDQVCQLKFWREKVEDVWDRAVRAHGEGRRPSFKELLPNFQNGQLDSLIEQLLELAEQVVQDVEVIESIFRPRVSHIDFAQPAEGGNGQDDAPFAAEDQPVGPSGHSSPPPIRAPRSVPKVSRPSLLAQQFGTPGSKGPRPSQSPYVPSAAFVRRKALAAAPAEGPDYTAAPRPSSIDKSMLRPFDNSQLRGTPKRPRQSLESGSASRPEKRTRAEEESAEV